MNQPSFTSKNQPDRRAVRNRVLLMVLLTFILCVVLVMRMSNLQLRDYERFSTRSEDNRIHSCPISPTRGVIYDNKGKILAGNVTSYNLVVLRHQVKDYDALFEQVRQYVTLSDDELNYFIRSRRTVDRCDHVILKSRLSDEEIAILSANRPFLEGVEIEASLIRDYPLIEEFSHSVGYIGSINERDQEFIVEQYAKQKGVLNNDNSNNSLNDILKSPIIDVKRLALQEYAGTNIIGKVGIEKQYEKVLLGQPGISIAETNYRGKLIRELDRIQPVPGKDLHLFLDSHVQHIALNELENSRLKIEQQANTQERERFKNDPSIALREIHVPTIRGSIVAIDVQTGGIVAMISNPSFDPNPFVTGYGVAAYNELNTSVDKPFLNRSINGKYAPASTIKPFIGLGAVDTNVVSWTDKYHSTGVYSLENASDKRDWKKGGHGKIDLRQAIIESVNTYFYDTAFRMTVEPIHDTLENFGLGQVTAFDIYGDNSGLNPSREWKKSRYNESWYAGDTVNLAIGQGYFQVTPMQMAIATAVMARKGKWFTPRLVDYIVDNKGNVEVVNPPAPREDYVLNDPTNWDKMHEAMEQVIYNPKGTAKIVNTPDLKYRIAGKTGTGQNVSLSEDVDYSDTAVASRTRDNAWFISFAPSDNPKLAIAIILENADHGGSVAAPIARKMFDAYLLDEKGQLKDFSILEIDSTVNEELNNE
ncbi:penicillin-binding protein 2 [Marinicellulosiphila megalodicopiae]|uniref:penicillin-binding protein 2 n=1 Tax=Marinicellulosiphila megalodicopiae TaxID=2724896 RepID=UPI003BAEF364